MAIWQTRSLEAAHVDPATAAPPASPNWAFAWPADHASRPQSTHMVPIWPVTPEALMEAFDSVARAEPRVEPAGVGPDPLWRSYTQRSRIFRFPDHISARAVAIEGEAGGPRASLIIYSRSVYGHSDLGVNAARLTRWIDLVDRALAAR